MEESRLPTRRIKALLFDLDDTLLINDVERFMQRYFELLLARMRDLVSPSLFFRAFQQASRAMLYNDGRDGTNAEVFAATFFPLIGKSPEELAPVFEEFFAHDFETLRQYTAADPFARPLMECVFQRGYQVAIATQPFFPRQANLARLRWAQVGAEEFPYSFITSYEVMRACKPHPHYFSSLLQHLGRQAEECLMVGDSPEADMAAGRWGIKTFWVNRSQAPRSVQCDAQGTLEDLLTLIETGGIDEL
ncbi:MAG: HAD family hydrolase [Anaerolineae bacterium]|nr:HAD family hydrolase [Anaerolineae bacterium]